MAAGFWFHFAFVWFLAGVVVVRDTLPLPPINTLEYILGHFLVITRVRSISWPVWHSSFSVENSYSQMSLSTLEKPDCPWGRQPCTWKRHAQATPTYSPRQRVGRGLAQEEMWAAAEKGTILRQSTLTHAYPRWPIRKTKLFAKQDHRP